MLSLLLAQDRLSLNYGGKPFLDSLLRKTESDHDGIRTTVYELVGGLKITSTLRSFPDHSACELLNVFENTGAEDTPLLSDLWDCDVTLPLHHAEPLRASAYLADPDTTTRLYAPSGSTWSFDEFSVDVDQVVGGRRIHHIHPNETQRFAPSGGRSSDGQAPFFAVEDHGTTYTLAVGWTGQWNAAIHRDCDSVTLRSGIENIRLRLHPGESFRTSSAVLQVCHGERTTAVNRWRRLLRDHFSLIGQPGRDASGPLTVSVWGGMTTEAVLARIRTLRDAGLSFDALWMDAGWYGAETEPTPNEFEGDWWLHTGDWQVSPRIHPDGLMPVAQAAHEAGMKFLLWFEPERVIRSVPVVKAHPDYFIFPSNEKDSNLLLDLGNPDAWQWTFDTLVSVIEQAGVDCYRQDFNFSPLSYWRSHDEPDRCGITEIRHITGLYRLWDALLERFPHLLIDDCASGGRRIDIEMLRRSMPLWRSDYQCPANADAEAAQAQSISYNTWIPYSGTDSSRLYDTYQIRSCYAAALRIAHTFSATDSFGDDPERLDWLRERLAEYRQARPYFSEDFYPLTEISDKQDVWCAAQFHRPSGGDGILQVFRRAHSPYETATFRLSGLEPDKRYRLTDADGGTVELSGQSLTEDGFTLRIPTRRTAKLFFYQAIDC